MKMHQSYGKQDFEDDTCFLCGKGMVGNNSIEHVVPKWLQNQYSLWDQKLRLLNGTLLPYRRLTIPCCKECNTQHLSKVEEDVSAAIRDGFHKAVELPGDTWYLWAGKIFYGILRKELSLLFKRSSPKDGTIVTKEILESFSNLHLFMQAFRGRHEFSGDKPYSVLICNLHEFGSFYDFRDNLILSTLAMRLGEVGIIISFEDGGLIRDSYGRYVDDVGGRKLHPIQFYELYAKVIYQVKRRQRPISYVTLSHAGGQTTASTEVINTSTSLGIWDQEEFAEVLRFHVSPWLNDDSVVAFVAPDKVTSWMVDSTGNPLILSKSEWQSSSE